MTAIQEYQQKLHDHLRPWMFSVIRVHAQKSSELAATKRRASLYAWRAGEIGEAEYRAFDEKARLKARAHFFAVVADAFVSGVAYDDLFAVQHEYRHKSGYRYWLSKNVVQLICDGLSGKTEPALHEYSRVSGEYLRSPLMMLVARWTGAGYADPKDLQLATEQIIAKLSAPRTEPMEAPIAPTDAKVLSLRSRSAKPEPTEAETRGVLAFLSKLFS